MIKPKLFIPFLIALSTTLTSCGKKTYTSSIEGLKNLTDTNQDSLELNAKDPNSQVRIDCASQDIACPESFAVIHSKVGLNSKTCSGAVISEDEILTTKDCLDSKSCEGSKIHIRSRQGVVTLKCNKIVEQGPASEDPLSKDTWIKFQVDSITEIELPEMAEASTNLKDTHVFVAQPINNKHFRIVRLGKQCQYQENSYLNTTAGMIALQGGNDCQLTKPTGIKGAPVLNNNGQLIGLGTEFKSNIHSISGHKTLSPVNYVAAINLACLSGNCFDTETKNEIRTKQLEFLKLSRDVVETQVKQALDNDLLDWKLEGTLESTRIVPLCFFEQGLLNLEGPRIRKRSGNWSTVRRPNRLRTMDLIYKDFSIVHVLDEHIRMTSKFVSSEAAGPDSSKVYIDVSDLKEHSKINIELKKQNPDENINESLIWTTTPFSRSACAP